ncbi:MAG: FAD-dependent monooxygenase [Acidimicrobiia bacterium]
MNIGVLGGGPAGLYFALLAKQSNPDHRIEVIERNPPGATFGWGVVFSPDTLTELRDADYETFVELEQELVSWNAIDIRIGGNVIRSVGQDFSAISRKVMLQLLQGRCREVGVDLTFEQEVDDLSPWAAKDLIVAADGVNSFVRRRYETAFRPTYRVHPTRYAWFGTDLVFDSFTFIFEETPWGLFQVHAYPFSADMSTFIVETTEGTWKKAGLDELSEEESLTFCQELFSDHLGDHRLRSNRSEWINFVTVACEAWHHDNIVLVGDAVHTAHFSIGSGTKLAVEDSVALGKALREHPTDLAAAFGSYELERQAPIRRFQDAARDSSGYFEHASRYLGLPASQFAFNLLTRSGRITHRSLELRDPVVVADADRTLAGGSGGGWATSQPPRLTPLTLRDLTLSNRLVLAPPPTDSAEAGIPGDSRNLVAAASAGVGMVVTEATAVSAEGRVTSGSPGLYDDAHVEDWQKILDQVHAAGPTAVALRLCHAGPRGATRRRHRGTDRPLGKDAWPLVAASPVAYTPRSPTPKGADSGQLAAIREDFTSAADRAAGAGFDVLLIDAATGYLFGSFISPLTNLREDDFGGDVPARLRFPLEVVSEVREKWVGPLGIRLAATDWRANGTQPEDAVIAASLFAEAGADFIEVCGGQTVFVAYPTYRRLHLVALADQIKNEADVVVMVGGNITTFDQVDTILASGRAELCVLDPRRYERSSVTRSEAPDLGSWR